MRLKKIITFLIILQFISITFIALNNEIYLWDEAAYIVNGMDLADEPITPALSQHIVHERHPMLSWTTALLFSLDIPLRFHNLFSPIFLFLFFLLTYNIGKKFYNRNVALLSSFILITIPTIVYMSTKIMTDVAGAFLFSLSLFFYYTGLKKPKHFLLAGLIGGISIIMRDMNLLLIPIMAVFTLIFYKKINLKYYFSSVLIAFISTLPYLIDNYLRWGNPLFRILAHIDMVNTDVGYNHLPLQNISYSWIIFVPIFLGIPIFYFFLSYLYKHRKSFNDKVKFLAIWFFIPFIIFIFKQKIDPRLVLIFAIPVLLLGSKELLSYNWKKFIPFLIIILVLNGFFLFNFLTYTNVHLSHSHKEAFDFIKNNIPDNEIIYSNAAPPLMIAMYTGKKTLYSLNTSEENTAFYLRDRTYDWIIKEIPADFNDYDLIFNNTRYELYKKH